MMDEELERRGYKVVAIPMKKKDMDKKNAKVIDNAR